MCVCHGGNCGSTVITPRPLLSPPVPSCLPCPLHPLISIHSTGDSALEHIRKFYPHRAAFLKGIIGHCSIYGPMSVCLCVCFPVSQLWIALSKLLPGAREAPDPSLLRISTSMRRDSPADDYHRIQNEISICSEVEIRGRRRDRDSWTGRGEETRDEGKWKQE